MKNESKPGALESKAATALKKLSPLRPRLAIVLGSGFQQVLQSLKIEAQISYKQIPGFPAPRVSGHSGCVYIGRLAGTSVMVLSGRSHYYEGHSLERVTFAVRTLARYGITDLLLTNAAGAVNPGFKPGEFMLLTDHINFMGANPLRQENNSAEIEFVDLTQVYSEALSGWLRSAARQTRTRLHRGVYLAVSGPSYETPAEIRMFRKWGADAVGMSTVPEAIVARKHNVSVAGLSCITNMAAGMTKGAVNHREVLETAARVQKSASRLIERFVRLYSA
jgi:purine-nucleoside phosphorylase